MIQYTARDDESNYVISGRPLVFANPRAVPISLTILHGISVAILLSAMTLLLRWPWFWIDAPRLPGFCDVSASDISEVLVPILLACGVRCFVKYFIIVETIGPSVDKQLQTMAVPSWIVDHRMAGAKLTVFISASI
jgi:hypothetical protein